MERKIVQKFHGKIGNVDIHDEALYWTTSYFLDVLEGSDLNYTERLVRELVNAIQNAMMKSSEFNLGEFEHEVAFHLDYDKTFLSPIYGNHHFKFVNRELLRVNKDSEYYDQIAENVKSEYDFTNDLVSPFN